ncbi:MAG: HAMP domain-containing sensor histidine kinase, partial [Planctomycetota bacterium]
MTSPRRLAWFGFGTATAVLLAVLSWLTATMTQLDQDELQARRQAALHERLRLALWRMDSWFSPLVAREASRAPGDYRSFPAAATAWTRGFNKLAPDDVIVPSPLLQADLPLFPLHFEFGPDGLASPQVPRGNERDNCEAIGCDLARLNGAAERLAGFAAVVTRDALEQKLGAVELTLATCSTEMPPSSPLQAQQSAQEFSNRQRSFQQNANPASPENYAVPGAATASENVGPLVPVWIDHAADPQLLFVRRVRSATAIRLQGMVVDWPRLQQELIGLVTDLFHGGSARLVRCEQPAPTEQPSMLASVPARLEAPCDDRLASALPMPVILGTTWGVTLLGLCVLGFTLRAALGYGERRARFASAVTHELRTPLTTFRMYSEMLADGVVTEPAARQEYLTTLQRESDRLARVVENVLAWSRLEEGRFTSRRVSLEVGPLLERLAPALQRRAAEAGMALVVDVPAQLRAARVDTDEDAVGQILFNLVDNAAKYAKGAADPRIGLAVTKTGDQLAITVQDHGPGVASAHRDRIFAPFDRGAVAAGSNDVPGVGLGLALA